MYYFQFLRCMVLKVLQLSLTFVTGIAGCVISTSHENIETTVRSTMEEPRLVLELEFFQLSLCAKGIRFKGL